MSSPSVTFVSRVKLVNAGFAKIQSVTIIIVLPRHVWWSIDFQFIPLELLVLFAGQIVLSLNPVCFVQLDYIMLFISYITLKQRCNLTNRYQICAFKTNLTNPFHKPFWPIIINIWSRDIHYKRMFPEWSLAFDNQLDDKRLRQRHRVIGLAYIFPGVLRLGVLDLQHCISHTAHDPSFR